MTTHSHTTRTVTTISRRSLVGASLAGMTLATCGVERLTQGASAATVGRGQIETLPPTSWHTWLLTSPDELRPAAPADPTTEELAELVQFQAERDDAAIALIQQWNSRPAVLPWTELANVALDEVMGPGRQSRAHGILQTAMYDAAIAAYDAQEAYAAPLPAEIDSQIVPLEGIVSDRPSFPSAEAAVAGAAATVLTGLIPEAAPGRFTDLADEVALTRLMAGLNVRRDIEAGFALGQAIGERALAHGAEDPSDSDWDGAGRLEGPGYWVPTPPWFDDPPVDPLAGRWRTWVMTSGDQFRPAPPPVYASPGWQSQLAAVQQAVAQRSFSQAQRARYWQDTATASMLWNGFAAELIARDGLDLPHAARALALMSVAQADAQVACWDAKYTYWTERPITADPELDVLFPTPPFPSYPSGHATVSNAAAVALASLFPDDAGDLLDLAEEAAASRCWAGIHFPIDDDAGTLLGRLVGYLAADVVQQDGAQ